MCSDCREANQARKAAQFEEPREGKYLGPRKGPKSAAGRKVLVDRLSAARRGLLDEIDRWESHPAGSWWRSLTMREWAERRYVTALRACWEAGIDVKA